MRQIALVAGLLLSLFLSACDQQSKQIVLSGDTMGTTWSLVLPKPPGPVLSGALQRAIESELLRINQLMSTYQADSQLSLFNALERTTPLTLHPEILHVLDASIEVSAATEGAYDVTLGSVIDLWGFGSSSHSDSPPGASRLAAAAEASGYHRLARKGQTLAKLHPELRIDLSSLAKGYAVDRMGVIAERAGLENYLAEIGGEIKTRGKARGDKAWRLGIENPNGQVDEGIEVSAAHVASSGSYRNYREVEGKRVSHLIDGRTHRPIEHATVAVTVLHRNTMLADAWATALMVVTPSTAKALVEQQQLNAQITFKSDQGFTVWRTPGFTALLAK